MARIVTSLLFSAALLCVVDAEIEFTKSADLMALMDNSDEQIVLGISTRGCGEPCELFSKFLTGLSDKMKGFFQVVQADVTTQVLLGSDESTLQTLYNITTIPMIQVFPYGIKDLRQPLTFTTNSTSQLMHVYQQTKSQKQVHDAFLQFLPQGEVKQLSSTDVEDFLTAEPAKGRVLLITSKSSTPPMLTKLALDYGSGMRFGSLRSSHQDSLDKLAAHGIEVDKFPTLLASAPGAAFEPYTGALNLAAIGSHLAGLTPGPVVLEVLSEKVFNQACVSKGGICVIALLPSSFDKHLDVFKQVSSRKFSSSASPAQLPITNFVWANADRQEAFSEGFGVEMFPAVVAMNPRKKLYSVMKGTFEVQQIRSFIMNVLQGKEGLSRMSKVPELEKISASMSAAKMDEMMRGRPEL